MKKNKLPYLEPKYLTENNLWDGIWLEEKYKKTIKKEKNGSRTKS